MYDQTRIRLSAVRALLGIITPQVRMIKISSEGNLISFTCFTEGHPNEDLMEAISEATSEIVSDFPDCDFVEVVEALEGPLPRENVISEGWIYQRYE